MGAAILFQNAMYLTASLRCHRQADVNIDQCVLYCKKLHIKNERSRDSNPRPLHFLVQRSTNGAIELDVTHCRHLSTSLQRIPDCRRVSVIDIHYGSQLIFNGEGKVHGGYPKRHLSEKLRVS